MNAQQTNPEVQIRLATPSDASSIASVLYEAFAEYESLYTHEAFAATTPTSGQIQGRMSEGPIWVAVQDDTIVGTVGAAPRGKALYVRSMAVLPEARGHRIGESLLAALERFAFANGYERLFLSTTPFLTRAIRLYERCGFRLWSYGVPSGARRWESDSEGSLPGNATQGPHDLFGTPLFTMIKDLERSEK